MSVDLWLTLGVFAGCLAALILTRVGPDFILIGGCTVLLLCGVLSPKQAFAGFANEGLLTIAVLFVLAAGLRETGALDVLVRRVLRRPRGVIRAQLRLMLPVSVASAFVNNTPLVAGLVPAVSDWARKIGVSPSRLMIPLSYAAILGGTCTIVGTSTNLVVNGLLLAEPGTRGLGFFELSWVGVPVLITGLVYVLALSRRWLPERDALVEQLGDPREYTLEMLVDTGSEVAGKSVEQAGLRHLPGLYLVEIEREGSVLAAVSPDEILRGGDRLVFAGITESILDLQRIRGLTPATRSLFKLDSPRPMREFLEAVIAPSSPAAHHTVRGCRFRSRYGAVVIAVARDGQRITGKIGDIELEPGDTLLLEAETGFGHRFRNSRDFLLLRAIDGAVPPRHDRAVLAWLIFAAALATAAAGWLDLLTAALLGAGAMLATRCLSPHRARTSIDLQLITTIAGAFGIATALETSGGGERLAAAMLRVAGDNPMVALVAIYVCTVLLTEAITNNAAAALMFPIAAATAKSLGVDLIPYAVAIMMAASASFATPIGYQTNLMIYGPGGYRFGDFLRFGVPLNVLVGIVSLLVIPRVWPLS